MYIVERTTADNRTILIGTYETRTEAEKAVAGYAFGYIRYEGERE